MLHVLDADNLLYNVLHDANMLHVLDADNLLHNVLDDDNMLHMLSLPCALLVIKGDAVFHGAWLALHADKDPVEEMRNRSSITRQIPQCDPIASHPRW